MAPLFNRRRYRCHAIPPLICHPPQFNIHTYFANRYLFGWLCHWEIYNVIAMHTCTCTCIYIMVLQKYRYHTYVHIWCHIVQYASVCVSQLHLRNNAMGQLHQKQCHGANMTYVYYGNDMHCRPCLHYLLYCFQYTNNWENKIWNFANN